MKKKARRDWPALLKAVRHRRNWSQEDLARELGVSWVSVQRWEKGARPSGLAEARLKTFLADASRK